MRLGLISQTPACGHTAYEYHKELHMLYLLSWTTVIAFLVLWSLAAWALHAISVWTVSNAGALSAGASDVGIFRFPDWLAPWVPSELAPFVTAMLSGIGTFVGSLLQFAPELTGFLTTTSWLIWGIGSLLLLFLGAGLHLLIAMWRRSGGKSSSKHRPRLQSAVHE